MWAIYYWHYKRSAFRIMLSDIIFCVKYNFITWHFFLNYQHFICKIEVQHFSAWLWMRVHQQHFSINISEPIIINFAKKDNYQIICSCSNQCINFVVNCIKLKGNSRKIIYVFKHYHNSYIIRKCVDLSMKKLNRRCAGIQSAIRLGQTDRLTSCL